MQDVEGPLQAWHFAYILFLSPLVAGSVVYLYHGENRGPGELGSPVSELAHGTWCSLDLNAGPSLAACPFLQTH